MVNVYEEEQIDFLQKLHDTLGNDTERFLTYKGKQNRQAFYAAGFYCRILQLSQGIIILYRSKPKTLLQIPLRSLIESSIHLQNIIEEDDPETYINKLEYGWVSSSLATLNSGLTGDLDLNQGYKAEAKEQRDEYLKLKNKLKNEIDKVIDPDGALSNKDRQSKRKIVIRDAFDKVKSLQTYDLLFRPTSGAVHGSINYLSNYQIEKSPNNYGVKIYNENFVNSYKGALGTSAALVLSSTQIVQKFFKFENKTNLENLISEHNTITKKLNNKI